MKIHIVKKGENHIENYERVEFDDNGFNLDKYSDNECQYILANDVLDSIPIGQIGSALTGLRQKLRFNGVLVVGGTDMRLFCKSVINSIVNEQDASNMIHVKKSMSSLNNVAEVIKSMGLSVQSTSMSGMHYEIKAIRDS